MGNQLVNVVIDAEDPARLGRWWAQALGYRVIREEPDEVEIRPAGQQLPGLAFVHVAEPKNGKNRLHFELRPDDHDAEVERLVDMGARHVDVDVTPVRPRAVVLTDPEGNEFCVRRSDG